MGERIIVYGAGAIGAQVGARLHAAGYNATLVEPWAPQREAISEDGLRISDKNGQQHFRPPVIAPDALHGPIDICFLAVKSYDTESALAMLTPHLSPDALVVSLQNSINEEWIAPALHSGQVLGGVILVNAVLLEPGHVTATASVSGASLGKRFPGIFVGQYLEPAGGAARRVAALMAAVWSAEPIDDLLYQRWSKMVNNVMLNSVSGISGMRSASMLDSQTARNALVNLAAEVLRVAEAEGHPIKTVMGDFSAEDIYLGAEGRSQIVHRGLAQRAARVGADAATSLLQDVLRGRRTEVDYFSGLVARKARRYRIETPYCDAVTALLHRVEAGTLTPEPKIIDMLYEMARP